MRNYFCNNKRISRRGTLIKDRKRFILLCRNHCVRYLYAFGSSVTGKFDENTSDIDLLVEFEEDTQDLYELKIQLKEFFQIQFGIDVDICREKYIKPRFKNTILKETVYA